MSQQGVRLTLVAALLFASCSSGDEITIPSQLNGRWVANVNASCAVIATFDNSAFRFALDRACASAALNQVDDQHVEGTFSADSATLVLYPDAASCSTQPKTPATVSLSVSSSQLAN